VGVLFLNYNTKRESRSECKLYNAWRVRRPLYTCNTHHHTVVRSDNMRRERFNFLTSTRFTPTNTAGNFDLFFPSQKLLDDISAPSQIDQTADLLDSHNGRSFTREGLSTKETLPPPAIFRSFRSTRDQHTKKNLIRDNQLSSTTLRWKERRIEESVDRSFLPPILYLRANKVFSVVTSTTNNACCVSLMDVLTPVEKNENATKHQKALYTFLLFEKKVRNPAYKRKMGRKRRVIIIAMSKK
jgi:hypothetical protein